MSQAEMHQMKTIGIKIEILHIFVVSMLGFIVGCLCGGSSD